MKKIKLPIIATLFFLAVLSFNYLSRKIPISYYDEEEWVGNSYFFQFFAQGNFDDRIWNTYGSEDQPMLTKLLFGLWLYPQYLIKTNGEQNFDYTKYLITNGYNFLKISPYKEFKDNLSGKFVTLNGGDTGFPNELVKRYGSGILDNIRLIFEARKLSSALWAINVFLVALFVNKNRGFTTVLIFTPIYAFNSLALSTMLLAHSEALFLLLFNLTLIYMYKVIRTKNDIKSLLLFSLFVGLCFSTKLNGIMLYVIYLALLPLFNTSSPKPNVAAKIVAPLLIATTIFVILNPYTYGSPAKNIVKMFAYREGITELQINRYPTASIPQFSDRIAFLLNSFATNSLFLKTFDSYFYKLFASALFTVGIISEIPKIKRKDKFSAFIFLAFLLSLAITLLYTKLAWQRYLIHLMMFIVYYQSIGIAGVASTFTLTFKTIKNTFYGPNK